MVLNISNCPQCGRVFSIGIRDVCPACAKEIDEQYESCVAFLREERGASIYELHEATGVSISRITKFIREGRISLADAPNLGYPCDVCSTMIREGAMCDKCRRRFTEGIHQLNEDERRRRERSNEMDSRSSYEIRDIDK